MTKATVEKLAAAAVILTVFVLLVQWTWQAHGDIVIDTGRELYMPWRITEGEVLYRDLAHFSGPFSQYWNALWIAMLGNTVRTLQLVNLAILLVTVGLVHALVVRISDRPTATVVSLVQLVVFSFAQINGCCIFDWVLPYCHELTHGVALAFLALWLLVRWRESGGRAQLLGLGFVVGITFLTKPEPFAALGVALALGVPLAAKARGEAVLRPLAFVVAAGAVPLLLSVLALSTAMPISQAIRATAGGWPYVTNAELQSLAYYRKNMGTDRPVENLGVVLSWLGSGVVLFGVAALLDRLAGKRLARFPWTFSIVVGLVLAMIAAFARIDVLMCAKPLPLVVLGVLGFTIPSALRTEVRGLVSVCFCSFALALLAKMLLATMIGHYGFALAMPAGLLASVTMLHWLPASLVRLGGSGVIVRGAGLGLLVLLAFEILLVTESALWTRAVPVGSGANTIMADPGRGKAMQQFLAEMERKLPHEATLAVLPEGVSVNWFLRARNPTGYVNFMPPEVILFGEEAMVAAFHAKPPDYVLLVHKHTGEYGLRYFGTDYGTKLMAHVRKSYQRVWLLGFEPFVEWDHFGMELLSRR